ncbi:DUF1080 domain-containing protein [uncultured Lutibacter sp.]|uniref:3-keto-disaccharide hydrolase n=1 Tax=uncultured Lutibacter sp. TaxID=437739 RepID=UPI0026278E51|nr:DUF1080 domain-containing protein [uncultured Lutibacter sp.]
MKTTSILNYLTAILIVGVLFTSCTNETKNKGFVKLHNGKNWDGWYFKIRSGDDEMAKKVYSIENEMVHVFNDQFPDSIKLNTGENDTHGLFYTKKKYSKFILKFEYKWGSKIANNFDKYQYDAGCYYHVFDDKIWPKGIEYQVRYNHVTNKNHTGDFWAGNLLQWYTAEGGNTFLHPNKGGILQPMKNGEHLASKPTNFNALNDKWNECEVIVMGNKYCIHKLNGEIVNMGVNLKVSEGVIGFQSETAEIFYRNIEIKEFDKELPIEDFLN